MILKKPLWLLIYSFVSTSGFSCNAFMCITISLAITNNPIIIVVPIETSLKKCAPAKIRASATNKTKPHPP